MLPLPVKIPLGWTEASPKEKDLGLLVGEKLNMSQQLLLAAQKSKPVLGCIRRSMASKLGEVILPLCSSEASPQVLLSALGHPT